LEASTTLALDEIQGNLVGFFKPFQRFVFLRFRDRVSAQAFLRVINREIDTCKDVLEFREEFRRYRDRGQGTAPTSRWFNLVLSARGLDLLEAPERELMEQAFREGMRPRAAVLGDIDESDPAHWISAFDADVHAMAILGADSAEDLERVHAALRRHLEADAHPVDTIGQVDGVAREGDNHGHEHFGFLDGISQPAVAGLTENPLPGQRVVAAGEFILGAAPQEGEHPSPVTSAGYGATPPAPAPQIPSWSANGSFVVFRRLRQDVGGFNQFIAEQSGADGLRPDLLEAKLVGRYKSGAPLERTFDQGPELDPQSQDPASSDPSIREPERINNFVYEPDDADGHLVPRAAHIRKTYPRNQNPPGEADAERRRILRRGITYGPDFQPAEGPYPNPSAPPPNADRGLVFVCYQASIENQFEFIQRQWVNSDDFPQAGDGRDPIISQDQANANFSIPPDRHLALARWVITTGGEYFFSPSVSALRALSDAPS